MLLLFFELGSHRYALDASVIREVLPLVEIRPIPQAPPAVSGVFDFRGTLVPVIDLSVLVTGAPAATRLNTRIVIVDYPTGGGETRPLGVIAERAIRTERRESADFVHAGVSNDAAAYLGPVLRDSAGLVQWIDVTRVLPAAVRDVLFRSRVDQSWPVSTSSAC